MSKKKREKTYWMELLNKPKRQTFRVLFCCHMVSFLLERKTKYKRPNSNKKYLLNAAWPKKTLKSKTNQQYLCKILVAHHQNPKVKQKRLDII